MFCRILFVFRLIVSCHFKVVFLILSRIFYLSYILLSYFIFMFVFIKSFYRFIVFFIIILSLFSCFIIIIFVYFFISGPIQPTLQVHQQAQISLGPAHKSQAWPSILYVSSSPETCQQATASIYARATSPSSTCLGSC